MAAEVIPQADGSEPSEGARLRSRGVDIQMSGQPHRLVFSYEAILIVEEEYDSLQAFFGELVAAKTRGQRFKAMVWGITACLLHEHESELSRSEILELRRRVIRGLDSKDFKEHFAALNEAIEEGLPEPDRKANPKVEGSRDVSPGAGSTTSRDSASAAPTESSGA